MVAGCIAIEAKPLSRVRPYRSLKPPFAPGYDITGLPPMISSMYLAFFLGLFSEDSSFFFSSSFVDLGAVKYSSQSHPSILRVLAYLTIFLDF